MERRSIVWLAASTRAHDFGAKHLRLDDQAAFASHEVTAPLLKMFADMEDIGGCMCPEQSVACETKSAEGRSIHFKSPSFDATSSVLQAFVAGRNFGSHAST
jgi:hypothetical protein